MKSACVQEGSWRARSKRERRSRPDFTGRLAIIDPLDRELFISLRCAVENLVIAVEHSGYDADVAYLPAGETECVRITLQESGRRTDNPLFGAIHEQLRRHLVLEGYYPQRLMRLRYGKPMPRSLHRAVAQVLVDRRATP